jgi:hypothetical protein
MIGAVADAAPARRVGDIRTFGPPTTSRFDLNPAL